MTSTALWVDRVEYSGTTTQPYCIVRVNRRRLNILSVLKHESSMASSRDTSGALFIDRDPTYFKYVLNYLRNGIVDLPPERYALNALLREAEFYQINVRSKFEKLKN